MHPQLYIPVLSSEHIGVQECCTYLILMTSNINYTLSFHIQFHKKLIIHLVAIYWLFIITKTPFSTEIESIVQQTQVFWLVFLRLLSSFTFLQKDIEIKCMFLRGDRMASQHQFETTF